MQTTPTVRAPRLREAWAAALSTPGLGRLLAGKAASAIGDSMDEIAVVWVARELAPDRAGFAIAVALTVYLVPGTLTALVFARWAGALAPRVVLLIDTGLRFTCLGGAAVLQLTGLLSIEIFVGLLFVAAFTRSVGNAAIRGLMRQLVTPDRYFTANTALFGLVQIASLVGPAMAGLLIAGIGAGWVLAADAASFAIYFLAVLSAPARRLQDIASEPESSSHVAGRGRGGLRTAWLLVVLTGTFHVLYGPMVVALPLYLTAALGLSAGDAARALGLAWSAVGLGSLISGFAIGHRPTLARTSVAGVIVTGWGVSTLLVGLAPNVMVVLAAMTLGGLVYGPYTAVVATIMQRRLTAAQYGRLNNHYAAVTSAAAPIGMLAAGLIVTHVSAATILIVSGVVLVSTGLASLPVIGNDSQRRHDDDRHTTT